VDAAVSLALEAAGLTKSYSGRRVVGVERLAVPEGEVYVLLGPNGSGKSTLMRMLALLEKPDAGEVRYFGRPARAGDLEMRRSVATVLQRPVPFQGKVWRNVALGLKVRRLPGKEVRERVAWALDLFHLDHLAEADTRRLSGGELQRVALARALVLRPRMLFLDEPTSALDPGLRARFRHDLMQALREVGSTVVLVTHDQDEGLGLAGRLAVLDEGRIVQEGNPTDVLAQPRNRFVADFLGAETLWHGKVVAAREGLCTVVTRSGLAVELVSGACQDGEVTLAIRPEEVILSLPGEDRSRTSARNRWAGTVDHVSIDGPVARVRVRLDLGQDPPAADPAWQGVTGEARLPNGRRSAGDGRDAVLTALVTRPSVAELGLSLGRRVEASVKATAVHVLED
jgi:tungstate transport system ATP-binding protein